MLRATASDAPESAALTGGCAGWLAQAALSIGRAGKQTNGSTVPREMAAHFDARSARLARVADPRGVATRLASSYRGATSGTPLTVPPASSSTAPWHRAQETASIIADLQQ